MSTDEQQRRVRNGVVTGETLEAIVVAENDSWLWLYDSATGYFSGHSSTWEDVPQPPTVVIRAAVELEGARSLRWCGLHPDKSVGCVVRWSDDTVTWEPAQEQPT